MWDKTILIPYAPSLNYRLTWLHKDAREDNLNSPFLYYALRPLFYRWTAKEPRKAHKEQKVLAGRWRRRAVKAKIRVKLGHVTFFISLCTISSLM